MPTNKDPQAEFKSGFKRALMLTYSLHPKWTTKERALRRAVLNEVHGKKRKR